MEEYKDTAELIKVSKEFKTGRYKDFKYDNCLKIVLYGDPIADSRPRVTGFGAVAVINLQRLKQKFKPLYQESKLLQNLMIWSKYHIACKLYMKTTKKDLAFIKSDAGTTKLYRKDKLFDMNIKDVDNMLKVHNDLLFANEYRICLDDAYNVGFLDPEKYTSTNPRIELEIYWNSKPSKWEKYKMENSTKMLEHRISHKYMLMTEKTPKEQMAYLKRFMNVKMDELKKDVDKVKLVKKLAEILEEYPSDTLKEMGCLEISRKYNKYDASLKVIILILTKHKEIVNILTGCKREV